MATDTDGWDDPICYSCQEERSWWRVWAAVAATIAVLAFGAMTVYNTGFAAGVNAQRAADRSGDDHKVSGCERGSCPYFLPQEPDATSHKIAL